MSQVKHIDNGYYLFRFWKRPIIALPATSSKHIKLIGISCFRNLTIKKALFSWAVRFFVVVGADLLLTEFVDPNQTPLLPYYFADWLDALRESLDMKSSQAVIIWPNHQDRGRVYVHLFSIAAHKQAFVKLSFNDYNDNCFLREFTTIETLSQHQIKTFSLPSIIQSGKYNNHRYLVFKQIPNAARPIKACLTSFPTECVREYGGLPYDIESQYLQTLEWWQNFWDLVNPELEFAKIVLSYKETPLRVCQVHGDLGLANMIWINNKLLIFDWETSDCHAPYLTDEISFYLHINQRYFEKKAHIGLRMFYHQYLLGRCQIYQHDIVMALAFLYSKKLSAAQKLVHYWHSLVFS